MNFDYRWDSDLHARRTWRGARVERLLARPRRRWRFGRAELVAVALTGVLGGLGWAALPLALGERSVPRVERGAVAPDAIRADFALCHSGGGTNCVVDGDTFWIGGVKIRIADIDTPETHPARCPREAELGEAATRRLQALLNSGAVSLAPVGRDADRYGRKLRRVAIDGRGVGDTLIAEGLARPYQGGQRAGWC